MILITCYNPTWRTVSLLLTVSIVNLPLTQIPATTIPCVVDCFYFSPQLDAVIRKETKVPSFEYPATAVVHKYPKTLD